MVAAYKGGSPDIESSWSRVDKYGEELRTKWNSTLEPDIPTLCAKVDAILLESNDGRKHLPQARQVIAARKPLFIDKPLASTLEDAREIARLAGEGRSNKEIAVELDCAMNTVEHHVTQLFRKTGTSGRTQLVTWFWSAT